MTWAAAERQEPVDGDWEAAAGDRAPNRQVACGWTWNRCPGCRRQVGRGRHGVASQREFVLAMDPLRGEILMFPAPCRLLQEVSRCALIRAYGQRTVMLRPCHLEGGLGLRHCHRAQRPCNLTDRHRRKPRRQVPRRVPVHRGVALAHRGRCSDRTPGAITTTRHLLAAACNP